MREKHMRPFGIALYKSHPIKDLDEFFGFDGNELPHVYAIENS